MSHTDVKGCRVHRYKTPEEWESDAAWQAGSVIISYDRVESQSSENKEEISDLSRVCRIIIVIAVIVSVVGVVIEAAAEDLLSMTSVSQSPLQENGPYVKCH